MRTLLRSLCEELGAHRGPLPYRPALPAGCFRLIADTLDLADYDQWKVVGWIESLNDLVYFQDVWRQYRRERDRAGFAEQLLAECQDKLYEHSYLDELFPNRRAEPARLAGRLSALCARLARELTQEALFLVPGTPNRWLQRTGRSYWVVRGSLLANYERVELADTIAIGVDGAFVSLPPALRAARPRQDGTVDFVMTPSETRIRAGGVSSCVWSGGASSPWQWSVEPPRYVVRPNAQWTRGLTLGPTLVYDRHRVPAAVRLSSENSLRRVERAVEALALAWPEGHGLLGSLTSRIVPLKAKGVVSFSYRDRPGISFINMFDRTPLDLIDDLIHENSHHHLNLLLRDQVLYGGDHNQEIFYSPWRRSLRPLRGILHATFTFTMGALLFERLAQWGTRPRAKGAWRQAGLTLRDVPRAHARCLEEIASVEYSLQDLRYAGRTLRWLPKAGRNLVAGLAGEMRHMTARTGRFARSLVGTSYARELARHHRHLQLAREAYGPQGASRRG